MVVCSEVWLEDIVYELGVGCGIDDCEFMMGVCV